jgi:aspartate carbamoyltransferase catalytic subunit
MNFRGSHILSVDQFSVGDIDQLFRLADEIQPLARRQLVSAPLRGAILGNMFFEPSTRSRISFGAAFNRLGGAVRDTASAEISSIVKGESLADTSRVVSGYVDVLVVRHPEEGAVREFAAATNIPVINAGDGAGEHPTQALLDLYTLRRELGRTRANLDGVSIAMVGDLRYGRTVHSFAKLLRLFPNVSFSFVAPDDLQMPENIVQSLRDAGHLVNCTTDLKEALADADAVYMTRVQEERFASEIEARRFRGMLTIDRSLYTEYCRPGTVLMHPLPRDSRMQTAEIAHDLDDHPALAIFRQTDNGIPIRIALFALVMGVEQNLFVDTQQVSWYVPERIGVRDAAPVAASASVSPATAPPSMW